MNPLPYSSMSLARAEEINGMLVQTWMLREGVVGGAVPSLRDITLADAIEASNLMALHPGERLENGSTSFVCRIDPSLIPLLFAWAVAHG